jgi:type IV pilus assembly protein PilP
MSGRTSRCALGVLAAILVAVPSGAEDAKEPMKPEAVRAVEPPTDLPFDPAGRRDPFRPPRFSVGTRSGPASPLQRYEIGQLRLVAIIYNTRDPRAVVEDDEGLGYIVKVGTPIGPNGGQVASIEQGKMVVEEETVDYYGDSHPSNVVMELRTADRGKR